MGKKNLAQLIALLDFVIFCVSEPCLSGTLTNNQFGADNHL